MKRLAGGVLVCVVAVLLGQPAFGAVPTIPGVTSAIQASITAQDIAGAVAVVVTKDRILHLEASGYADLATRKAMRTDSLFWIASMTKPVTAVSVLLLQDEGRLSVNEPIGKYLPEFAGLKTPSGKPADITLAQLLTHTSGIGDISDAAVLKAHTLAELIPLFLAKPMQFEPGAKWKFSQAGVNTAARVVEVVSGMSFDVFVQKRILDPLGMKDTTFRRTGEWSERLATAYMKDPKTGKLEAVPPRGCGWRGSADVWEYGALFDGAGLCEVLSDAAGRRGGRWKAVSQCGGDQVNDHGSDGRVAYGIFPVGADGVAWCELWVGSGNMYFTEAS